MQISTPTLDPVDSANAQFLGLVLNLFLYGLLVSQVFTYYLSFASSDLRLHKLVVHSLFALETLQTILMTYDLHQAFVLNFGDVVFLDLIGLAWFNVPILCGLVGWIAEMFCAYRIYRISRNRKLSSAVVFLVGSIAEGIRGYHAKTYYQLQLQVMSFAPLAILWVWSMITCDILIAVAMTYYLMKYRKEFQRPSPLIKKLIALTVETGTVTAMTAAAGYVIGKAYSNSVLRIINNRNRAGNHTDINTFPVSLDSYFVSQQSVRTQEEGISDSSSARS